MGGSEVAEVLAACVGLGVGAGGWPSLSSLKGGEVDRHRTKH
jgi:hypothetical protein